MESPGARDKQPISQTNKSADNMRNDKNNKPLGKRDFTLVEILIAITIVLLISAVAATRMGAPHSSITARTACGKIEKFLAIAKRRAAMTGKRVRVVFQPSTRLFVLNTTEMDGDTLPTKNKTNASKQTELQIPEGIEIKISQKNTSSDINGNEKEMEAVFSFFPDATAAGPTLIITSGNAEFTLSVSRLTGLTIIKEPEVGK